MWRTASTTLPVPASPLVRIIAAPSPMRRSASPRSRQPQTNGTLKACLLMWCCLVGGRQHLALVDVVDAERLEDLRLDEMADAALGHHRDRDRLHDLPGSSPGRSCAPRRPARGYRRARAPAPSRPTRPPPRRSGLLGVDHIHDHAALEHLGEVAFDAIRSCLLLHARLLLSFPHAINCARFFTGSRRYLVDALPFLDAFLLVPIDCALLRCAACIRSSAICRAAACGETLSSRAIVNSRLSVL